MLPLSIEFTDVDTAPPIIVYVYDYDTIGDDDLIGMKVFDVSFT